MPRRPTDSPRKKPRQARAQATVEAILRASAHILRTSGWEHLTTNAVAKKAGVSIGSLYQYFPSKDALLASLAQAHADEGLEVLMRAVLEAGEAPRSLEETVRRYIRAMVAHHARDPKLHRVLVEQVPRLGGARDGVRQVSAQASQWVLRWLESQRALLRPLNLEIATFVLVTAVEAVTYFDVVPRPASLTAQTMEDELTALVLGYLGVAAAPGDVDSRAQGHHRQGGERAGAKRRRLEPSQP